MSDQELLINKELQSNCILICPEENADYILTIKEAVVLSPDPEPDPEFVDINFDFLCKIKKIKKKNLTLLINYEGNQYTYEIENGAKSFTATFKKGAEVSGTVVVDEKKRYEIKKFIV